MNRIALLAQHDNEGLAELNGLILESKGFSLEFTRSLDKALELIAANNYSVVVADINLGKARSRDISPGKALYHGLEKSLNENQARLILISGEAANEEEFNREFSGRRNVTYLQKPYNFDKFIASIQ